MARVTDVFMSGTVGNIVLYRRMDKNCARVKREGIQQTAATKIRSENFGIASRVSSHLRKGLYAVIPAPTDRSMQSRFSGAIARWLRLCNVDTLPSCEAAPCITGFQFTGGDAFNDRFRVPIAVSQPETNIITVCVNDFIPVKKIIAPAGTVMIELVVAVAGCMLKTGIPVGGGVQRIQVPYNENEITAQKLQFKIPLPAGCVVITGAWLQYFVLKNNRISRSENAAFMPAGVLNARYTG
ncbi:MAG TPA: hypothetical protein VIJ92_05105 [Ginsengibacter sp.]